MPPVPIVCPPGSIAMWSEDHGGTTVPICRRLGSPR
jgi:hypothetical protein